MPDVLDAAPRALTRAMILKEGQSLPVAPRIMAQLGEMLSDIDTDVTDIARVLRTDPALTTRVVRMSNTIMFGGGGAITDIESALARVGFSSVLGLVGAAGVTQLAPEPLTIYGIDIDTFQRCSLCHALAAEAVADAVREDAHAAYIAALVRSVGMIVLDRASSRFEEPVDSFPDSGYHCYADYERSVFGLTSTDATRMLLDEWKFPEEIVSAVDLHHLNTEDALSDRLACVVNVAGEIASGAGYGFPGDTRHWTSAPGKYEVLGVSLDFWNQISTAANERFVGACESLKAN